MFVRIDKISAPKPAVPAPPATVPGCNQILCCAFNADGSIFVTGSSDKIARVRFLHMYCFAGHVRCTSYISEFCRVVDHINVVSGDCDE